MAAPQVSAGEGKHLSGLTPKAQHAGGNAQMTDRANKRFMIVVNEDRGEYSIHDIHNENNAKSAISEQRRRGRNITYEFCNAIDQNAAALCAGKGHPTHHHIANALAE